MRNTTVSAGAMSSVVVAGTVATVGGIVIPVIASAIAYRVLARSPPRYGSRSTFATSAAKAWRATRQRSIRRPV